MYSALDGKNIEKIAFVTLVNSLPYKSEDIKAIEGHLKVYS